jgi:hypothetical protein
MNAISILMLSLFGLAFAAVEAQAASPRGATTVSTASTIQAVAAQCKVTFCRPVVNGPGTECWDVYMDCRIAPK